MSLRYSAWLICLAYSSNHPEETQLDWYLRVMGAERAMKLLQKEAVRL